MFMLFSIFLYIFTVYVKVTHLQKLYIVLFLFLINMLIAFRRFDTKGTSLFSNTIAIIIVGCIFLFIANYLPNLVIGFSSARIVGEITRYFNIYKPEPIRL